MSEATELTPIGRVESTLTDRASVPKQGTEGAPDAWLVFDPAVADDLRVDELQGLLVTCLAEQALAAP